MPARTKTQLWISTITITIITTTITITVIEHLASRGGLRAIEGRRACDGVFVMQTWAQRTP